MIVSIAIAVLPVPRSPMISSRWPRPIGIIESIAFMPVCIGSCTDLREMMPGALISTWRFLAPVIGLAAVDRDADRVDDAAEQLLADRHLDDAARALDDVAFADGLELAEERDADVVLLEVEHHAVDLLAAGAVELEQLAGHRAGQAVDAGDAVTGGQHGSGLGDRDLLVVVLDLLADDVADLCGADIHGFASLLS